MESLEILRFDETETTAITSENERSYWIVNKVTQTLTQKLTIHKNRTQQHTGIIVNRRLLNSLTRAS